MPEFKTKEEYDEWKRLKLSKIQSAGDRPLQKPSSKPSHSANAARTQSTRDPRESLERLKQIYQDFTKPIGRLNLGFGLLSLVVLVAGICICVSVSWLVGVFGFIAFLVLMVNISNRLEEPHKSRAKKGVSVVETTFGLSHEESLQLLLADRGVATTADATEWKAFVTEVWGTDAVPSVPKERHVSGAGTKETFMLCPNCGSTDFISERDGVSKAVGWVTGAVLGALLGSALGVGQLAGQSMTYAGAKAGSSELGSNAKCKRCGHKWDMDKPTKPAAGDDSGRLMRNSDWGNQERGK